MLKSAPVLPANKDGIAFAAAILISGRPVALPTETVYGLAANALNSDAVEALYAVKNRPKNNPLIIHVSGAAMAAEYVEISPLAAKLIARFWPGPLSLVLPLRPDSGISPLAAAGLPTLAVRSPQGVFAKVIAKMKRPLAAPSANISGRLSPTTAQAAARALANKIPLVLDGGVCAVGVESTIIAVENEEMRLLRAGGLPREDIEAAMGQPVRLAAAAAKPLAPGMLASHYAPEALVRTEAKKIAAGEALLAFGGKRAENYQQAAFMLNLSEKGDMREAAAHLFAYLAALDADLAKLGKEGGKNVIAVEPIPEAGLGAAINDRLRRAAAARC